jgi:hypothetical protein
MVLNKVLLRKRKAGAAAEAVVPCDPIGLAEAGWRRQRIPSAIQSSHGRAIAVVTGSGLVAQLVRAHA